MKHTVVVDLRGAGREEGRRGDAFQFVKRPHLGPVGEGAIIIGVDRVAAEGRFGSIPFLVQVAGLGVDVK